MCRSSPTPTGTSQPPPTQQQATSSPFTIRQLNNSTYLIRENDIYGEHPHIYAKLHPNTHSPRLIILIDCGVGTTSPPSPSPSTSTNPTTNIWTFLSTHLNPSHTLPYHLLLTHCHYDHILGLTHLPRTANLTITASSHTPSFTTPYPHLQSHSLCAAYGLSAPHYTVAVWADDGAEILVPGTHSQDQGETTGLSILHTPGHTPDSLSVWDAAEGWLYVGDGLYAQTSAETEGAPWGREGRAPIVFPREGEVGVWWRGVGRLVEMVEGKERDIRDGGRVRLAAGHVTAEAEALGVLVRVRAFMGRVLRGEIKVVEVGERRGERTGFWGEDRDGVVAEFSLTAPLRVVEEGRKNIPEEEWK